MELTNTNKLILELFDKGFKIEKGKVFSQYGREICLNNREGYLGFSHRMRDGKTRRVEVHRLVAYKKFGSRIFKKELEVRHLDGDCQNNFDDNIDLGTPSDNAMDKLPEVRMNAALIATSYCKIHLHDEVIKRRNEGATYSEIMNEFDISSKGTVSFIINKSRESKYNIVR